MNRLKNKDCLSRVKVGDILHICCNPDTNMMRYISKGSIVRRFPVLSIKGKGCCLVKSQTESKIIHLACGTLVKIEKKR